MFYIYEWLLHSSSLDVSFFSCRAFIVPFRPEPNCRLCPGHHLIIVLAAAAVCVTGTFASSCSAGTSAGIAAEAGKGAAAGALASGVMTETGATVAEALTGMATGNGIVGVLPSAGHALHHGTRKSSQLVMAHLLTASHHRSMERTHHPLCLGVTQCPQVQATPACHSTHTPILLSDVLLCAVKRRCRLQVCC